MRAPLLLLIAALLAVLAASPAPARADASADEADLRFVRGAALFKSARYQEALLEFLESNRLVPNRNVVFNIARSYEALQRYEEAYRYYAEYVALEPDEGERAAAARRLVELAPYVALLRIESEPPGATVFLGRVDLGGRGRTPLLIAVPPGEHKVILRMPGYRPVELPVTATRGSETPVRGALQQVVGALRVQSTPPARVFVNRVAGSKAPPAAEATPALLSLPPGRHTIELEAPGHRPHRADVVIREDSEIAVQVRLEERPRPSGTVVLAADVAGARVTVDGVVRGFTPAVLSLVEGRHEIEVRGEGHRPWRRTVQVEKDGRTFFDVKLEAAEQEVTGATRTLETLSTAPASVTLLSRHEIWAFGYQRLTEAVRSVRGFYTSDDMNYEAIGIRGFSRPGDFTNRVLLLRDGHPMNDDWIGSAAVGRDFAADLDDVSRIEIVRGPGSTFYGPGAFFGVIQVVSEQPGQGAPVRAGGSLSSTGGGTAFARGTAGDERAAASVYASVHDSAGRTLYFDEFAGEPSGGEVRGADAEDAQRGGLRARAGEFALDASIARRRKDVPTAPYGTVIDPARNAATGRMPTSTIDRRGYVEGRWSHRRGPLGIAARASYDHQSYDGVYPYDDGEEAFVFADDGQGNWLTGELRLSLEGGWHRLTVGGEVADHTVVQGYDEEADGIQEFRDRQAFQNGSVYGVEQVSLGERVHLSGGLRADWFGQRSDSAVSPRLGAIVRPYGEAYTKLVAGSAFRPPSVYELHYNDGGITQIAPESLEPETIWTGEIEHTHPLGSRSYLLGSLFASRISDLIVLGETDEGLLVFENSPEPVSAVGAELEGRLTVGKDAWVAAAASVTRLATRDEAAEVNSAAAVASLRGYWPVLAERLALAAEVIYNAGRERRDGRTAAPALLGRLFASGHLRGHTLQYRVGVTNLFDWDWAVPVGEEYLQQSIRQEPRTFHVQLVYEY